MKLFASLFVLQFALSTTFSLASSKSIPDSSVPDCLTQDHLIIPVNNEQVIQWKNSTENQFASRGHVSGIISELVPDRNGHTHFGIIIVSEVDGKRSDSIEIIYNTSFGKLQGVAVNAHVEACGDYITSNQDTAQYPASPFGALVHWVHLSKNPETGHVSGYVAINGVLFGTDPAGFGSRP